MTTPVAPQVDCEQLHASLSVPDVRAASDFYAAKLGFFVSFTWGDPPTIAGVNLGSVQMFLEKGTPCPEGCRVYFVVSNADALFAYHRSNGWRSSRHPRTGTTACGITRSETRTATC